MSKEVLPVSVRSVLQTHAGRAVFLGNDEKVFVIYVDESVGLAITMFLHDAPKERPLTHDLMSNLLTALGAKIERIVINELKTTTYYARLIISVENEVQAKKIIELDARPSDCIALAAQSGAAMYVAREVWDEVDDMSEILRRMEEGGLSSGGEEEA